MPSTLLQKVWEAHSVRKLPNGQTQLFIGLHLIHEVTSPQAFDMLRARGSRVMFPDRTIATVDHIVPTKDQRRPFLDVMAEDMLAAAQYLKQREDCTGKVGVVGFCWGGGVAHRLAAQMPDLAAAVPFYGNDPGPEDAPKVKAPLLVHMAESDKRINVRWPAYAAALKEANVPHEAHIYPGTQHGFNNDTTPRYDEAAAKLAWQRTVDFFKKHLT